MNNLERERVMGLLRKLDSLYEKEMRKRKVVIPLVKDKKEKTLLN